MDVRSALDDGGWAVEQLVDQLSSLTPATPFDAASVAFCRELSQRLLADPRARALPAIAAVGYWLRPAAIERLRARFAKSAEETVLLMPRGIAFHVTPANVDTIFLYSWILSLLAGNLNVVRLSTRETEVTERVLDAIRRTLADDAFEGLRARNYLVHTSHDDRISAALSAVAAIRVVWGGDAVIDHFRSFPLPPRGRDLTFPDRHSLAILDAAAVSAASDREMSALGEAFFNDAYWFDQGACSSPRLLIWQASSDATVDDARLRLHEAVATAIERRHYRAETGIAIAKMVYGLRRAAVADGVLYERRTNEATWVRIPDLSAYDRDSCGGGLFFEYVSRDLESDLAQLVQPRDQTAATFGLDADALKSIADRLKGRGIDRFVPVGRALEFSAVWDGYDLLQEFSRRVVVDV